MAVYQPKIQLQLQDGCALGGLSCTCYAGGMAGDRATLGKTVPHGCTIRKQTGDHDGGTTLTQVAAVLQNHYNIDLWRAYYIPITDVADLLLSGRGVVLQGGYWPVRESQYSGSETFGGNHAVYINEYNPHSNLWHVFDPLADGRRSGIAKGPDWWPDPLVREFAAALVVNPSSGRTVGKDRAWCGYTKPTHTVTPPAPSPTPSDYGVNSMIAAAGILYPTPNGVAGNHKIALKKGQTVYKESRTGSAPIVKMSADAKVPYLGSAGGGFKAVLISTAAPYPDHVQRNTVGYVTTGVIDG